MINVTSEAIVEPSASPNTQIRIKLSVASRNVTRNRVNAAAQVKAPANPAQTTAASKANRRGG